MKKSIFLFISSFFISCGVQTKLITPENITTNIPELNTINNTEIGVTLVSKEIGYKYSAIKITKGKKPNPRHIVKEIKEGDVFINESYTSKFDLYRNQDDITFGVAISKNGGNAQVFKNDGIGVTVYEIIEVMEYKKIFFPVPKKEYFKQEFIYNGKVGNGLKFIYREYVDDFARPAFTQDLQYDLSESKIIGFRGLRIEVISATNTNIEYKVLNQFK